MVIVGATGMIGGLVLRTANRAIASRGGRRGRGNSRVATWLDNSSLANSCLTKCGGRGRRWLHCARLWGRDRIARSDGRGGVAFKFGV